MSSYNDFPFINQPDAYTKPNKLKGKPKNKFSKEEDSQLVEAINKYGIFDWESVAKELPGRTSRQCRDRWNYYLNPDIKNKPWSEREEQLLLDKYKKYGPKWALIAQYFDSRTDISIKNHFWVLQRRSAKEGKDPIQKKKKKSTKAPKSAEISLFPGVSLITPEDIMKTCNLPLDWRIH